MHTAALPAPTLTPTELVSALPGRVWARAGDLRVHDVELIGVAYEPWRAVAQTRCYSVIAYVEGSPRLTRSVDERWFSEQLTPGEIVFKSPGHGGEWAWDRPTSVLQVHLSPSLVDGIAGEMYGPRPGRWRLHDAGKRRDDEVSALMQTMAREARAPENPGSLLVVRALARRLVVLLLRAHARCEPQALPRFDARQLAQVEQHLAMPPEGGVSLGSLAEALGMAPQRCARLFRASYDCTLGEHLLQRRLTHACELMRDGTRSLAGVAALAGFADQSHLTRCFSRRFGQTPGRWRRQRASTKETPCR